MRIPVLPVIQPIGTFYLGVLPARILMNVVSVERRTYDVLSKQTAGGPQRYLSPPRLVEIAKYCEDPDATFPTSIIVAVDDESCGVDNDGILEFDETRVIGSVIDGQHRLYGIAQAPEKYQDEFNLPVAFMFDLEIQEKAYIFSIINSKQTRVPSSLIYDLFGMVDDPSPQKTCHEVARTLNSDPASPFYTRLKMLGRREENLASLSQGAFVKYLMPLLSKTPDEDARRLKRGMDLLNEHSDDMPFRSYLAQEKDEVICKVMSNLFTAIKNVFGKEWETPKAFILSKTVGYAGMMRALPNLIRLGTANKTLKTEFFEVCFQAFRDYLDERGMSLTSEFFPSNESGRKKLADALLESVESVPKRLAHQRTD